MRVYMSVDIEGITGIVNRTQTGPGERDYERGRRLMTREANAAIQGALDGGATEIVLADLHGPMTNLLIEELLPPARLISGRPRPGVMMQGISSKFDVAFLIGYHGRHGTVDSILDHTWSSASIVDAQVNGRSVSEGDWSAAQAGYHGVPVVLVTGDDNYCRQQKETLGEDLITVAVKAGLGRQAADSLCLAEAHRLIREAAARAVSVRREPYRFQSPYRLVLTYNLSSRAEMGALIPGSERIDGLRVAYTTDNFDTLIQAWWAMLALGGTV